MPLAFKSKFIHQFKLLENLEDIYSMENVAGEQGLALQQIFPKKNLKFIVFNPEIA